MKFFTVSCILGIAAVMAIGPEKVSSVIEKRFFSTDNYQSDATRRVQIDALMSSCDENPLFGNGLGGYTTLCIRDRELPHSYEVQWVAFLMQFGLFGILFLFLPLGFIAWKLVEPPLSRTRIGFFLLFALWIVSGFTNPFMISLTSGIVYASFLAASEKTQERTYGVRGF